VRNAFKSPIANSKLVSNIAFLSFWQVPFGVPGPLTLTPSDKAVICKWIDNKLGEKAVRAQKLNKTTNLCEATHRTVLKSIPKSGCFPRNFEGRAHSALHSVSNGQHQSTMVLNAMTGACNDIDGPAARSRETLTAKIHYHKARKMSTPYKAQQKRLRVLKHRTKTNADVTSSYSAGCQDPEVQMDHAYKMI